MLLNTAEGVFIEAVSLPFGIYLCMEFVLYWYSYIVTIYIFKQN